MSEAWSVVCLGIHKQVPLSRPDLSTVDMVPIKSAQKKSLMVGSCLPTDSIATRRRPLPDGELSGGVTACSSEREKEYVHCAVKTLRFDDSDKARRHHVGLVGFELSPGNIDRALASFCLCSRMICAPITCESWFAGERRVGTSSCDTSKVFFSENSVRHSMQQVPIGALWSKHISVVAASRRS